MTGMPCGMPVCFWGPAREAVHPPGQWFCLLAVADPEPRSLDCSRYTCTMSLSQLESRLHYQFRNAELLRQAMTHRSHSATHNERLEFLGDSVLNCAVAALLFQRFGQLDEGDLSRVRANLVKQQSLYEIAQALNISEGLRLGEGELRSGGFRRPSILADTLEAIFGAVFLDGGFDAAH